MATFTSQQKEEEKQETWPILEGSYLGNNLVTICNMRWCHWLAFPPQKSSSFVKESQSYI